MKFLNDEIFIEYYLDKQYHNTYQRFELQLTIDKYEPVYKTIYTGRVFISNRTAKFYCNDILNSYLRNATLMKDLYEDGMQKVFGPYATMNSKLDIDNKDFTIRLIFPDVLYQSKPKIFYYEELIFNGSPRIGTLTNDMIPLVDDTEKKLYTTNELLNEIYPRYPRLKSNTKNMFIIVDYMISNPLRSLETNISQSTGEILFTEPANSYNVASYTFKYPIEFNIAAKSIDMNTTTDRYKLAEIDECPSDFYCLWIDRLGGTQCQPFNKRSVLTETVNTKTIANIAERVRPYNKSIVYKWELNTDWLDEKSHGTYESILASPYIYLYDVKKDLGYWVNCDKNSWTEKTIKNQTKLFNFNVTLTLDKNQNITY